MIWSRCTDMKPALLYYAIYLHTLLTISFADTATSKILNITTTILPNKVYGMPSVTTIDSSIVYSEPARSSTYSIEIITTATVPKLGTKRENKGIVVEDVDGVMDAFFPVDEEDEPIPDPDGDDEDEIDFNSTERGEYLGSPCEFTCNPKLHHVYCDPISGHCECEKKYPVRLGYNKGCAKPKKLGEQCFYRQTCKYADAHSSCVQINHNAICQCDSGYHSVTYARPVKRIFCTEDMALLTADVPTLLGVSTGIAVLAGLLCLVLHLYTRARHPRHPHLADASLSPPLMFTSETGIPMALHSTRPSSRSSQRSSGTCGSAGTAGTLDSCAGTRRTASRGVPVSASRAGSRRPSLASVHSSSSSVRSYSARRFEREREQKERRQQMQMRLARLHANMAPMQAPTPPEQQRAAPTPSPKSPNSTDGLLLPAVNEAGEMSLSRSIMAMNDCSSSLQGFVGPCSSSAGTSY